MTDGGSDQGTEEGQSWKNREAQAQAAAQVTVMHRVTLQRR